MIVLKDKYKWVNDYCVFSQQNCNSIRLPVHKKVKFQAENGNRHQILCQMVRLIVAVIAAISISRNVRKAAVALALPCFSSMDSSRSWAAPFEYLFTIIIF